MCSLETLINASFADSHIQLKKNSLAIIHNALQSEQERDEFCEFAQREFPPAYEALNRTYKKREHEGELKYRFTRTWKLEAPQQQQAGPEAETATAAATAIV